jgi:hypothetical protein
MLAESALCAIHLLLIESGPQSSQEQIWNSLKRVQRRKLSTLPIRLPFECAGQRSAKYDGKHRTHRIVVAYLERWQVTFRGIANSLCENHHGRL